MPLTWGFRALRRKELKQRKLISDRKKLKTQKQESEEQLAQLEQQVKKHRQTAVDARVREVSAKREMDRSKSVGSDPLPKHIHQYEEAKEIAGDANRYESEALRSIQLIKTNLPEIPQIPPVNKITLNGFDLISISFFVLIDIFKLSRGWVMLIVGGSLIFIYLEKHYGLLERFGL